MMKFRYRKKRKFKLFILFIFLLLCLGTGYSSLNTQLRISGSTQITGNTWDIGFTNISATSNSATVVTPPSIINKTKIELAVNLNLPGEEYEYTVNVTNGGTIDAKLSSFTMTQLTSAQQQYLEYTVTYDNGNSINVGDALNIGQSRKIKIKVKYKNVSLSNMVATDQNLTLTFQMNFIQKV